MRTEVKIGIVVGLVVIVGGILYIVSPGRKGAGNEAQVLPVDAPAGRATPGKNDKPATPRPGTPDRTAAARPTTVPPAPGTAARTPGGTPASPGTTRPPVGTPPTFGTPRPGEPNTARPVVTAPPPEPTPTTQPSGPLVVPPLVTPTEPPRSTTPGDSGTGPTTPPAVTPAEPNTGARPPAVTPAPRKEPEPVVTPPPLGTPPRTETIAGKKYTVVEGDTLSAIAEDEYGDRNLWPRIKAANPGLDENRLLVGQVLVVPPKEERAPAAEPAKPAGTEAMARETPTTKKAEPEAAGRTHVVARGETLRSIARNVLHDEAQWRQIYELNKSKIANPDVLLVGTELRLPETAAEKPAEKTNGKSNEKAGGKGNGKSNGKAGEKSSKPSGRG